jgi:hypothetical protein
VLPQDFEYGVDTVGDLAPEEPSVIDEALECPEFQFVEGWIAVRRHEVAALLILVNNAVEVVLDLFAMLRERSYFFQASISWPASLSQYDPNFLAAVDLLLYERGSAHQTLED